MLFAFIPSYRSNIVVAAPVPPTPVQRVAVEVAHAQTVVMLVQVCRALRQVTAVGS